jgi:tRNA(Ile)-lysidine synthase
MDREDEAPRARRGVSGGGAAVPFLDRCTFPPAGNELLCAVSGGADSLAMLVLAVSAGCEVTAIHVDHGLRPGSAQEAGRVEEAAQKLGASFRSVRVDVGPGPNLEARARKARKEALPPGSATGHTLDDQAETVLLRLIRGTGPDGLAAMRPGYEHPILSLRRTDTVQITCSAGLEPIVDPSNSDPSILRNRVRHELLPLCSELAGRDVAPLLTRLATLVAADADLLCEQADSIDPTDAKAVAAAPVPLATRALRRWLRADGPYPPDLAALERVLAVARGEVPGTEIAPAVRVRRTAGRLRAESLVEEKARGSN